MALSSFDGWSSQWSLDGGRKDRQAFCVVPIILPRSDKIWGILWWLTRVDTYVWMILMCCKFDKAPPILRNEGWRCLGDVKSLNFSVIFRGGGAWATFSGWNVSQECCGTLLGNENDPMRCLRDLEFIKANGDAFKWWPDLRGVTISYVHESEAGWLVVF